MAHFKVCKTCGKIKPLSEYSARRLVCKECFNISQKSLRSKSYGHISTQLFQEYEQHPLISPLLFPNNKYYKEHLAIGSEHRQHPHWFVLFHLLTHHQLDSALRTFCDMYSWQYKERYNSNYDSQSRYLAEFFNPSIYSKEQILRELYESNHHCFPTQPGHSYYRHRRHRIMVKTHRMFFKQICKHCNKMLPTYHINYDAKPNWLQYLMDTIFMYKDCYPLPINYVPILSYKNGWTGTCNTCRKLPLSTVSWEPHELNQGFTNRGRYLTVIREAMLAAPSYQPRKEQSQFGINKQNNPTPDQNDSHSNIYADEHIPITLSGSGEVLDSNVLTPEEQLLKGILYY